MVPPTGLMWLPFKLWLKCHCLGIDPAPSPVALSTGPPQGISTGRPSRQPHDRASVVVPFGRFSPDLLGLQASSALAWLTLEVVAILLSLYLVTVNTDLTTIDLVAFLGYKYVG